MLKKFSAINKIKDREAVFFSESMSGISPKKIEPYLDTDIISLFTHSEVLSHKNLDVFPNLKLIATRSTGFNHIDLEYCKKRGIVVSNVPRYGEATVAEFAFGLLLALSRKIIAAQNDMARNRIHMENYMGFDLLGKTIGIVGTGSIGRHMIKIAQGFGMKVLAYDLYPAKDLADLYVKKIDDIFEKCDIISLHVPSTKENWHMLNAASFSKMKKGVVIINTARGDLIDVQALYKALRDGIVAGAGLDVLENEDFLLHDDIIKDDRLKNADFLLDSAMNLKILQLKNVIATPHIAFNSVDAVERILKTTYDNINGFLAGTPMNNVVK
jgi:D-lactate dehydrogenase